MHRRAGLRWRVGAEPLDALSEVGYRLVLGRPEGRRDGREPGMPAGLRQPGPHSAVAADAHFDVEQTEPGRDAPVRREGHWWSVGVKSSSVRRKLAPVATSRYWGGRGWRSTGRVSAGSPIRAGHSSYAITADIYSHVAPAQAREAADRLDEAIQW